MSDDGQSREAAQVGGGGELGKAGPNRVGACPELVRERKRDEGWTAGVGWGERGRRGGGDTGRRLCFTIHYLVHGTRYIFAIYPYPMSIPRARLSTNVVAKSTIGMRVVLHLESLVGHVVLDTNSPP